jgi:hypothetical protein
MRVKVLLDNPVPSPKPAAPAVPAASRALSRSLKDPGASILAPLVCLWMMDLLDTK